MNMKSKALQDQLKLIKLSADKAPDLDLWQKFISDLDHQYNDLEQQNLNLKTSKNYLQSYAIASSKKTVLGELLGGITHEINNPLAVIQLRADQLLELTQSDDIKKEFFIKSLTSIDKTVKKISEIINELRSFSKSLPSDAITIHSLSETIQHTLALCSHRFATYGIQVNFICPEDFLIQSRASEISQLLIHLLNNAFDAVSSAKEKWITIEAAAIENNLILTTTDSGSGIAAEIQDKIFQPFFTTKTDQVRAGLGLSSVKNIIDCYQGSFTLDLTSVHTKFKITMPIVLAKVK